MSKKVAVFIDFANIDSAFRNLKKGIHPCPKINIDLIKLIDMVTLGREIVTRSIYLESRKNGNGNQGFLTFLSTNGFTVVAKELKTINVGNGKIKNKADFDVEIAFDICAHIWKRECDEIVLLSGDSDFGYLVDKALELNIEVTVVSTVGSLSKELRDSGANIIKLDDLNINQYTREKTLKN